MSDNTIKAGVEDVLSSVKRLVSEEGRKVPDLVKASAPRKPGRLVLTDALRVGDHPKVASAEAPLKLEAEYSADAIMQTDEAKLQPANDLSQPMRLRPCDIVQPGEGAEVSESLENAQPAPDQSTEANGETADLADSLSAKIEALEAAIARTEDQWEPDGESDDAYSGTRTTSMNWSEEVESSETFEDEDDAAEELDAAEDPEFVTEEVDVPVTFIRDPSWNVQPVAEEVDEVSEIDARLIDEAALQDLVAQVVRQELQGALGERITRNVRKMVRREINRALAEQDLE
ncbi:hypothetical protein [Ruegeria arenilitoris]|uniref:hypothetical protein n=1 Tax=Ruegeria arenilitoris TaxID=1173585 RepID=UPI00147A6EF8|nr:hypothetical protein [Ruegeria arenilitoris]